MEAKVKKNELIILTSEDLGTWEKTRTYFPGEAKPLEEEVEKFRQNFCPEEEIYQFTLKFPKQFIPILNSLSLLDRIDKQKIGIREFIAVIFNAGTQWGGDFFKEIDENNEIVYEV